MDPIIAKRTRKAPVDATPVQPQQQPQPPRPRKTQPSESPQPQPPQRKPEEQGPKLPGWVHVEKKYIAAGWETIKLAPRDQTAHIICKRHTLDPNGVPTARAADLHIVKFGPMNDDLINCATLLGGRPVSANIRIARDSGRMIISLEDNEGKKIAL